MKKEENDFTTNGENVSPKLVSLAQHLQVWLEQYPDEDFTGEKGIGAILLAYDKEVENSRLFYALYNKDDPQGDIIRTIDHGVAGFLKNDGTQNTHDTKLVFESMAEFMALIFAKFPSIYEAFQICVENYRRAMKDHIENGKNGIII